MHSFEAMFVTLSRQLVREVMPRILEAVAADSRSPSVKTDGTFVTDTDTAVERHFTTRLQEAFPSMPILGEEAVADTPSTPGEDPLALYEPFMRTGQQIVIDPIDGTKNFVEGRGEFCIAAALTHSVGDGIWPVAGVVALPVKGIMWWTDGLSVRREVIASGAVEEIGRRSVPEKRISVSSKNRAWLAENAFEMKLPWISSGSSVHDFMGTATGELCGSMVGKQRLWDLMAPLAIALRLGSELRDLVTGQVVTCINPSDLSRDLRKRPWGIERKMVLAPRETKLDELIAPR